jgi:hypothetical protein
MSNKILEVTRWWVERADPDFDEESVDHLVDNEEAEILGVSGQIDGDYRVDIQASVEEDGEMVDYTVSLTESLIHDALDEAKDSDAEFTD